MYTSQSKLKTLIGQYFLKLFENNFNVALKFTSSSVR